MPSGKTMGQMIPLSDHFIMIHSMIFWSTFLNFFWEFIMCPSVNMYRALKKFPHNFLNLPGRGQKCWTISLPLAQKDVQLGNRQNAVLASFICPPFDPLPPYADLLASPSSRERLSGKGGAMFCFPLGRLQFSPCMHTHLSPLKLKVSPLWIHIQEHFTYPQNHLSPWCYLGSWISF